MGFHAEKSIFDAVFLFENDTNVSRWINVGWYILYEGHFPEHGKFEVFANLSRAKGCKRCIDGFK